MHLRIAVAAVAALASPAALALATSAPQAEYRPVAVAEKTREALVTLPADAHRIALAAPVEAERAALKRRAADTTASRRGAREPLRIGYPRLLPEAARVVALVSLAWRDQPGGARAARIEVESSSAEGLRAALSPTGVPSTVTLRFQGNGTHAEVMRPVLAGEIATAVARDGVYWTPVLEGDVGVIELVVPAGTALPPEAALSIDRVSHLVLAGRSLERVDPKRVQDIGDAASCNVDFACIAPSAPLSQAANSVGKLVASDPSGVTVLCTGTLLNDTVSSFTPYLFTANHCIDSAFRAASLNVYWFFRAASCNSLQVPPYVLQDGGSKLLARSRDYDWALVGLNREPPTGVYFAAWRAEPVPQLAVGTTLHHPQGDLLQFTQGSTPGYEFFEDGESFLVMQWSQGTTETGSSGGALFTFLAAANTYEVRGGLYGGDHSCTNRGGVDYYSRLDDMLPLVRQYLTPTEPNVDNLAVVVEYYNASLDHYFITTFANEIEILDSGTLPGWQRTGLRFLAWTQPTPGANPVCRFYLKPEVGDSHFYSGDPLECAQTAQRFGASWVLESPGVFYVKLPDPATSACPAGTRPVWRFYNFQRINHRYTAEALIRNDLQVDPRWIQEGYGPDAVIMCSPLGS